MTYQEAIEYMYTRLPMFHRVGAIAFKKDLTNTLLLCEALGRPDKGFKSIHIAGTNGKGSSSHMIAAILQSAGYKVGLYTSPHLKDFSERIRINGIPISQEAVVAFIDAYKTLIEEVNPSFFELTVAMAFDHFNKEAVDYAVIEVGLGGRLDSTNIITPICSLITNISWDHADMLGDSLEKIAFEKAGIIKPSVPVVVSQTQPEVAHVFKEKANKEAAPIIFADQHIMAKKNTPNQVTLSYREQAAHDFTLGLLGDYQIKNVIGVYQLMKLLHEKQLAEISDRAISEGLKDVVPMTGLKGRWQIMAKTPLTVCDTGHNEDGIRQVVEQIARTPHKMLYFVIGVVKEKDLEKMIPLLPQTAIYYCCKPNIPRGLDSQTLYEALTRHHRKAVLCDTVTEALSAAQVCASEQDMIFVGGSTFVVAEIC